MITDPDLRRTTFALPLPLGVDRDPGDPGRRPITLGITIACLSLTTIAVFTRIFVKAKVVKKLRLEDYLLLAGLAGTASFVALAIVAGDYGSGKHQWNVSLFDASKTVELHNIMEIVFGIALLVTKLANIIQLRRIFVIHPSGPMYWSLQFLAFAHVTSTLALTFAFVFQCWPREKIWHRWVEGKCISGTRNLILGAAIPAFFDWATLIVPIIGMREMAITWKTKLRIYLILLVALFASICSVNRLVYTVEWTRTDDWTWTAQPVIWWGAFEISSLLVIICFPTMPQFYNHLRHLGSPTPMPYTSELDFPTRRRMDDLFTDSDSMTEMPVAQRVDSWEYVAPGRSRSDSCAESLNRASTKVSVVSWDPEAGIREATMGQPLESKYY